MCAATKISSSIARPTCDPSAVPFETTADARPVRDGVVGQPRAVSALRFGIGMRRRGYNVFAAGPAGVGKATLLRQYLEQEAPKATTPPDYCYVHDFAAPVRPRVLALPPGAGVKLRDDMETALSELRVALRAAFDSQEYRSRKQQLVDQFGERQSSALERVAERARERDVAVVHTDSGIAIAPLKEGAPLEPAKFRELPEDVQQKLQAALVEVDAELQELFRTFHEWGREQRQALSGLDREIAAAAVHRVLSFVRERYAALESVLAHLSAIEQNVVDNVSEFLEPQSEGVEAALSRALKPEQTNGQSLRRFRVNVVSDHSGQTGAPIVFEDQPTYANLLGRVEHETQFGALITNFTLIRSGAFHRAGGGYLVLDALKLLQQPLAWEALKRTLRSGEIRIDSLGQQLGLVATTSLEPMPVPLGDTKVILTGERGLYDRLAALDPEFLELFKVLVEFDEDMARGPETLGLYAELVASLVQKESLRPLDRSAVARVIDQATRAAGDAEKLSVHMRGIMSLLQEADYWAAERGSAHVSAQDVEAALDAQRARVGRIRMRLREAVRRGQIAIVTTGACVGQVNGLSVFQLGEDAFGQPTRITARVHLGKGELLDIEREVALGGPIHSKGVLILGGFLTGRYAPMQPLALSATLVFEQSYGGVEGDSASLAELCTLLSAIAELPLAQSIALTGSVDQRGQVQAIGGVNEKIEGFFDVCNERGLTGDQGVIIPRSNVTNLMLRADVAAAIENGTFHVHAVDEVDDALGLLSGRPAGVRDAAGSFPEGSVNALVEARLLAFADCARKLSTPRNEH